MDMVFPDWKNGYFVAYLRRVFAWGGFRAVNDGYVSAFRLN